MVLTHGLSCLHDNGVVSMTAELVGRVESITEEYMDWVITDMVLECRGDGYVWEV